MRRTGKFILAVVNRLHEIVADIRAGAEQLRDRVRDEADRIGDKIDKRHNEQLAERLDDMQAKSKEKLNWRAGGSVDLLKVIGLPSGLPDRKGLASDLGFEGEFTGSASDNTWLREALLDELAEHGFPLRAAA